MQGPWVQRFSVAWPATLAFFQERYAILEAFDNEKLLRQFRVREDEVALRLGDATHLITFGVNRLELGILRPDGDLQRIESALGIVLEALRPTRLLRPSVSVQWIHPIQLEYEQARVLAAEQLFRLPIQITDFAVLFDGKHEKPDATSVVEFGILEAPDIPARLARMQGRVSGESLEAPPTTWPLETFPDVALFADTQWEINEPVEPTLEGVITLWRAVVDASEGIVSELMNKLKVTNGE